VVDRHASEKEKTKDLPTYKDKDFLGDGRVLCVGSEIRQKLLNVFQADTDVIICIIFKLCVLSRFALKLFGDMKVISVCRNRAPVIAICCLCQDLKQHQRKMLGNIN